MTDTLTVRDNTPTHHFHYDGVNGPAGHPCHNPLSTDPFEKGTCPQFLADLADGRFVEECDCDE